MRGDLCRGPRGPPIDGFRGDGASARNASSNAHAGARPAWQRLVPRAGSQSSRSHGRGEVGIELIPGDRRPHAVGQLLMPAACTVPSGHACRTPGSVGVGAPFRGPRRRRGIVRAHDDDECPAVGIDLGTTNSAIAVGTLGVTRGAGRLPHRRQAADSSWGNDPLPLAPHRSWRVGGLESSPWTAGIGPCRPLWPSCQTAPR